MDRIKTALLGAVLAALMFTATGCVVAPYPYYGSSYYGGGYYGGGSNYGGYYYSRPYYYGYGPYYYPYYR
jgi:hypothetical protein